MIAIIARLEIEPSSIDEFIEAAKPTVTPTLQEKGCLLYSYGRDLVEDNVIWISEQWETEDDLNAHLQAPHIAEFLERTQGQILSMDDRKYEVSSWGPVVPREG